MTTQTATHFGMISLVFFRRHVETGEPLLSEPCVWTYDRDDANQAKADFTDLRTKSHLFVPEQGLTLSTCK